MEDVAKGVARRQHWITVRLSTVASAGAVRYVRLAGAWDRQVEMRENRNMDRWSGIVTVEMV